MDNYDSICQKIKNYVQESPLNLIKDLNNLTIYDEPVIALASATDPLFHKLKEPGIIGPGHMSPQEWLPEAQTIISYFLPFSQYIRESNRVIKEMPSTEWLYGRIDGEAFNRSLRQFVVNTYQELGIKALSPGIDPRFKYVTRTSSNWSERHVAYIAGLGTFNLSKSFITKKGCAGRFGSIIVSKQYEPTPRVYNDIYELCTNCGACIRRCPVNAISAAGKDHTICANFIDDVLKPKYAPYYGCGKCQTAVPCENRIPG